jgi:long-chain fatty acid transport protein
LLGPDRRCLDSHVQIAAKPVLVIELLNIYGDSQFNVKNSSFGDNGGGNAGYFGPVPTLNYVHSVSPDLKLGLGVGSYFGLGLNYSNEWAGKFSETHKG